MKIEFLGHSSFAITGTQAKMVTDPFDPAMMGIAYPKVTADIVTVSHEHSDHNNAKAVGGEPASQRGEPVIFRLPGEYERRGVRVYGYETYHDDAKGRERGKNTMFKFILDGMVLLHCGDLGHIPSDALLERIKDTDILMIPVGGTFTIDAKQAKELVTKIAPSIVLPMHYGDSALKPEFSVLTPVDEFLKLNASTTTHQKDSLTVTEETLPEEREIVVLKRL
ncbi:hypothetical protein COU89_03460 [Candidatus Roizmanbacteria bacterium CG10_big_fil_rev_8_21_14_0_10_45_7]|uniref:Lactamase n=1 Tax=Candidatus Roizmanbacteria bacterium CG10_big_fil_rev_8_21_14_0_10_45_7 TaxID=1974854 RepID=A0A2M8KU04_9BACT|nr:MAG: hypothetical protein COU89_03460 [Candidatus Roizmanbacteria bacterium CG10_big_fil_rev_8_21_14_0_10_45_7]